MTESKKILCSGCDVEVGTQHHCLSPASNLNMGVVNIDHSEGESLMSAIQNDIARKPKSCDCQECNKTSDNSWIVDAFKIMSGNKEQMQEVVAKYSTQD